MVFYDFTRYIFYKLKHYYFYCSVEERKELQKLLSCINKKLVTDRTQCPTGEKDRYLISPFNFLILNTQLLTDDCWTLNFYVYWYSLLFIKSRLKSLIHQELQNSGVRTELESKARTLIQEAGGVDQVDVEQLVHQLISILTSHFLKLTIFSY